MDYQKTQLLNEGKTKKVWATQDKKYVILQFKDDSQRYHGKRKVYFEGKAHYGNMINATLMKLLEENGIPTHYKKLYSETEIVALNAEMIPIEVVVRNYAAGSMCTRLAIPEGQKLKAPVLEFCYKNDALGDPVINEYHAYAMGLCSWEELNLMYYQVVRINKVLSDVMTKAGIALVDFKVEFGRSNGRIVVADEITPTTSRMWANDPLRRFGGANDDSTEYVEVYNRLYSLGIGETL